MTLLLIDGCEDLSSWVASTAGFGTIVAGRNGNCIRPPVSATPPSATFDIQTADQTDTLTIGWALNHFQSTSNNILWELRSDSGATLHNRIRLNSSHRLEVTLGTGTVLATSSNTLLVNTWYYVEVTVKLHDTTGSVTIRVDGATVATFSGDTKNAGTKTVYDQLAMGTQVASSQNTDVDDLYVTNDATPLGDARVETLYPNGNGATNQWVGSDSDSVNNYLLVDEVPADTSDYTFSATAGERDLYAVTDLGVAGVVRAICHTAVVAKSDSGARQVKLLSRGSTVNASPVNNLTTTFRAVHWCLQTNPETGAVFTVAELNGLQTGVEVV